MKGRIPRPVRTQSGEAPPIREPRQSAPQARPPTLRERELLEETEFTRPVDFHSFRRAFKQGLADAGVELQTAMTLSGATDAKTHARYLANTSKLRTVPLAALPFWPAPPSRTAPRSRRGIGCLLRATETAFLTGAEGRT